MFEPEVVTVGDPVVDTAVRVDEMMITPLPPVFAVALYAEPPVDESLL